MIAARLPLARPAAFAPAASTDTRKAAAGEVIPWPREHARRPAAGLASDEAPADWDGAR